jgi:predicted methyltransferase
LNHRQRFPATAGFPENRTMRHFLLAVLLGVAVPALVHAEATEADLAAIKAAIESPDRPAADRQRDTTSKPAEVFAFFGVRPGMRIVELMAGGGYNVEILTRIAGPQVQVVAQNNQPYAGYASDAIAQRYAGNRLPNVRQLTSDLNDMQLGKGQFDMVLLVMSWHDAYWVDPKEWPAVDTALFMKQIHDALKPGGIVAVIDHHAKTGSGTAAVATLHRIDEQFVRAEFDKAGFEFVASSELLRHPEDDRSLLVFDEKIRGRTDRFIHKYRKPAVH